MRGLFSSVFICPWVIPFLEGRKRKTSRFCGNFNENFARISSGEWNYIFCVPFKEVHFLPFNVSCNLSRNALRDNLHAKFPKCLHLALGGKLLAQRSGKLLEIVAESRTLMYFPQRFLQLVSPHFRPLQGMLLSAMFRATYPAITLRVRDKLLVKRYVFSFRKKNLDG